MLRLILVYASSTGLQRALVFLAVPVLSGYLTLAALGTYALAQTVAQFAIPVLAWNATVALTREAIENPRAVRNLLRFTVSTAALLAILISLASALVNAPPWIYYGVALGGAEACFAASISVLQGREAAGTILTLSTLKTFGIVASIVATPLFHWPLTWLLLAQIFNSTLAATLAFYVARRVLASPDNPPDRHDTSIRLMLAYSAATLPHTAALWLSVSSDRLFLGALKSSATVGSYAIAYTISLSVMLLMSGVIAALPPRIAREPVYWSDPTNVNRVIRYLTAATFVILLGCFAGILINRHVIQLIANMPPHAGTLIALIGSGFYASFYYVLFASYMYLHRETGALAKVGLFLGPLNLVVMALLVWLFGPIGAALGLLCSYSSFGYSYYLVAIKLEPGLKAVGVEALRDTFLLIVCASLIGLAIS